MHEVICHKMNTINIIATLVFLTLQVLLHAGLWAISKAIGNSFDLSFISNNGVTIITMVILEISLGLGVTALLIMLLVFLTNE